MSGGVDSSVTAKLMVDQVSCIGDDSLAKHILTSFTDSRVMTLLGCSCGTGIQETNPEPMQAVNGRRIGKMCGWCLSI